MTPAEQERRYAEVMGKEALERQRKERKARCSYCGARDGQHANLCIYARRGKK